MNPILNINHINKKYKDFAINDLSFHVEEGTIMGLIGPNGAGKTTTLKAIMNMISIDSGSIEILGLDHKQDEKKIKQSIGYVFDECPYFPNLTLEKNAKMIKPFYPNWDETLFLRYLTDFELNPKKKICKLSKGMKTKFSIAVALSQRPRLLIMDEPTAGLDPIFRRELLTHLHEMIDESGCSILFSSHITSDLDKIADFITFIYDGKTLLSMDALSLKDSHLLVKGHKDLLPMLPKEALIGVQTTSVAFEAITNNVTLLRPFSGDRLIIEPCAIEDLMYYYAKEMKKS